MDPNEQLYKRMNLASSEYQQLLTTYTQFVEFVAKYLASDKSPIQNVHIEVYPSGPSFDLTFINRRFRFSFSSHLLEDSDRLVGVVTCFEMFEQLRPGASKVGKFTFRKDGQTDVEAAGDIAEFAQMGGGTDTVALVVDLLKKGLERPVSYTPMM